MKKIFKHSTPIGIVGVLVVLLLSSFALRKGAHSYSLSVNGKEVGQYYVGAKKPMPSITLTASDKLSVYYNECGKIGSSRGLSVRDDQNKILKEWKFDDNQEEHTPMTIITQGLRRNTQIGLYYTSRDVTTPQKLATLSIDNNATATGN